MSAEKQRSLTDVELWQALEEQAAQDDMDEIAAMDDATLDAELRAKGVDPALTRAKGAALAEALFARRDREEKAALALADTRARMVQRAARRGTLSREALVVRIERARHDPRLAQSVAVAFRNRNEASASIEELESLLDEIEEVLALTEEANKEEKPD